MYICELCGQTHHNHKNDSLCFHCESKVELKRKAPRKTVSDKTKSDREVAKAFGGRALTGTAKQKKWAESIRAEFIKNAKLSDAEIREYVVFYTDSKTWIENREKFASM